MMQNDVIREANINGWHLEILRVPQWNGNAYKLYLPCSPHWVKTEEEAIQYFDKAVEFAKINKYEFRPFSN